MGTKTLISPKKYLTRVRMDLSSADRTIDDLMETFQPKLLGKR